MHCRLWSILVILILLHILNLDVVSFVAKEGRSTRWIVSVNYNCVSILMRTHACHKCLYNTSFFFVFVDWEFILRSAGKWDTTACWTTFTNLFGKKENIQQEYYCGSDCHFFISFLLSDKSPLHRESSGNQGPWVIICKYTHSYTHR